MNFNNPSSKYIKKSRCYEIKNILFGIPYVLYGRNKNGLDCFGCVVLFYKKAFNIDIPEYTKKEFFNKWKEIKENPALGDPILFDLNNLEYNHVGVLVAPNKILHIGANGVQITFIDENLKIRVFRHKGVKNVQQKI